MSNTSLLGSFGGQGDSSLMFRNRIINGAMVIDQRNAGAAVTPIAGATYLVDRFALETSFASKLTFRQVSNTPTDTNYEAGAAPSGFTHSLKISVASSYTPTATENSGLFQQIEGFNIADFAWGTAEAKPVSISFWIKGSVTGKYTIHVRNIGETRTFLSTITINAANTWEYKTITIPGCTDGTWLVNNQRGIFMSINLGAGANFKGTAGSWLTTAGTPKLQSSDSVDFVSQINGSTLYITGVQLEAGPTATPFERRPYSVEEQMCFRYFQKITQMLALNQLNSLNELCIWYKPVVPMRTSATATVALANADYIANVPTGNQWTLYRPGVGYSTKTGTVIWSFEPGTPPVDGNLATSSGATFSGGGNNKISATGTSGIYLNAEL